MAKHKIINIKENLPSVDEARKKLCAEIDNVLAKYYGFTEEELDFIINYEIKYRMGKELEG